MKLGRNDPCPCNSGKKYKRCCMDSASKQHCEVFDEIAQTIATNPDLSLDEMNLVAQHKISGINNNPLDDFCGLSANQMDNWLRAPFNELAEVTITIPNELTASPVMRYLAIILDEAMHQSGSFKATAKGNLPAKIAKQASELLPEFAVSEYEKSVSISEFSGSNEDKINALHYTRILADIAGIIYLKSGSFHIKKIAQKQYQTHGIKAFFLPMLEAATTHYNWGYFDSFVSDSDLRIFWVFMLWRIQTHGSVEQLIEEVITAFPALLNEVPATQYKEPQDLLGVLIRSRFIERFLEFWGFITVNPKRFSDGKPIAIKANIQPLLKQTFTFDI
ncbi:SecC motif-containing protein [Pseudoalteromonas sp. A601]|uniref:YecA family protein n=1 Tax=Pseudoalteromonas sp. A601 TaxID=1967839 RepID=UPI000B3C1F3E|nr:SEC-C domain-containing protein [Pseudoalteromonas sp. A601]OUS68829.1 SecC motif-containing protein [Pseudoalteromonas sp. A601]